jgi:heat shock protein HtpX
MYNQIDSNKRRTWALIIIFVVIICAIGWFISYTYNDGYLSLAIATIFSLAMALFGYYGGDKVALLTAGAKPLQKADSPYLHNMVENLCITAGLPQPKIYLMDDGAINAFATGRDPKHASIAVTTGALQKLENEELEGVIAHELSHIKNYDIRLMMIVIVLVGIIALLSDWFLRFRLFGGRKSDNGNGGNIGLVIFVIGIVLLILSPLIAQLIKLSISRRREYLADASGALLTRYPEGLARALEKINQDPAILDHANNATAHLYIANPFKGSGKFMAGLFSTHPPIEERIKKLREMA